MSEDESFFCPDCGAPVRAADGFCPSCGSNRSSDGVPAAQQSGAYNSPKYSTALLVIIAVSAIWAVVALWQGISTILSIDALETMITDAISEQGGTIDDEIVNIIVEYVSIAGYALLLSGLLTIPVIVLSLLKRRHKFAVLLCVCASIFALLTVLGIVGFIVAYFLQKRKPEFLD
jgi:hypothetical protein